MLRKLYHRMVPLVVLLLLGGEVVAGPSVDIVHGKDAPELERFAATEMANQLKRLFDADVTVGDKTPVRKGIRILVGSPKTNSAIASLGGEFPKLSDQGHLIRSQKSGEQQVLIVGGGSPVATLWAVYELGHHFGIRYALFGDMYPTVTPELKVDGIKILLEPVLKDRTWRTINDLPIGPESWGIAEQEQLIKQLAKLKYNRLLLTVSPWQPFVDFEFQGAKKNTALLSHGERFQVDGDTAGRAVFKGAKFFENPDFAGKNSYSERIAAGTLLAKGIIQAARKVGMSTALSFSPLEFSREFATVLPTADKPTDAGQLSIGPRADQPIDSPQMTALVKAQIRAYLSTYPDIDAVYLSLPRDSKTGQRADPVVTEKDFKKSLEAPTVRRNQAALNLLNQIIADNTLLRLSDGRSVKVVLAGVNPAIFTVLDKNLPAGAGTLHFVDSTTRCIAENRTFLKTIPTGKVPCSLSVTLGGSAAGMLPEVSFTALKTLVDELHSGGWNGFATQFRTIGDHDLAAYYLSRASFAPQITPQQALEELTESGLGIGTFGRTMKAFELVEQASLLIDQNDINCSVPSKDVIMKHYASSEAVPEWWGKASGFYADAMNEMYRVNTRSREGNRDFSLYLARRFEFGMEYFNCLQAVRKAGIARSKGDKETQMAELEKAVESMHGALNALSAVARSNSDRGVIAVLNEYGYRPLKKEMEAE